MEAILSSACENIAANAAAGQFGHIFYAFSVYVTQNNDTIRNDKLLQHQIQNTRVYVD